MQSNVTATVITNPMIAANRSAEVTLSKFLRVLSPCFSRTQVIGGNLRVESDLADIPLLSFQINRSKIKTRRIVDVLFLQFRMAVAVLRYARKGDPAFFWIGDKMILPYLAAKIKGAEINYFIYGNVAKEGHASLFTKLSSKLIRFMAEHADYTCMESESVIHEWPGLKCKKQRIIHLYTDFTQMNGLSERENIVGMVCRLTPGKHVTESIRAFAALHQKHPQWRLEIIGSGKQEEQCASLITELHANDYIIMHGWVEHEHIHNITRKWKYLLFPTDTEGLPNGLIEMMGQGIPAIASPVGGIKDILQHGKNGWQLKGTSELDIQDSLIQAWTTCFYHEAALASYQTIYEQFSLDTAKAFARDQLTIQ